MSLNGTRLNHNKGERTKESETRSLHPSFLTLRPGPLLWARFLTSEPERTLLILSAVLLASVGKESACNAEDPGSIPGLGRSPGEGERLPTPVFWPGEFRGLYRPWGHSRTPLSHFHFHLLGAYSGAGTLYAAPPSPQRPPSEVGTGSSFYG